MTTERAVAVDGETIRVGTGLFDAETGEVFWYGGLEEGAVFLEGVGRDLSIDVERFRARIVSGRLVITCQPPGCPGPVP